MIDTYRSEIDKIDAELTKLLNKRMDISSKIGAIKSENDIAVFDSTREEAVLQSVEDASDEDKKDYMLSVYSAILSNSKAYQSVTNEGLANKKVLVINGPNINMLGKREKEQYGSFTYDELLAAMTAKARTLGIEVDFFQSNSEADIIDKVQGAGTYDALIINPAAYTHTSIAILDALLLLDTYIVEVHISNILNREEFRQVSITGRAADVVMSGARMESYLMGLDLVAKRLMG